MKIKIINDFQSLKKDAVISNMCATTADVLIAQGVAVRMDGPKLAADPPPATDPTPYEIAMAKPLAKCNVEDLRVIVETEKIDPGEAKTKAEVVVVIEAHRKEIENDAEIEAYLAARETCDETCRYAEGEECTLPEDRQCPQSESDDE